MIANGSENARQALTALQRLYKSKQNSHGLLRVAKRALELNPADLVAANNCASLGLLLTGDSSARRLAAKLHVEHPANTVFSATYAFALHLEGKTGEALKVMETLQEAQLRHPAIAAYYFVMLVENGKMERAHSFLSAANQAALLPEEQQLLTAATHKLLAHDSQSLWRARGGRLRANRFALSRFFELAQQPRFSIRASRAAKGIELALQMPWVQNDLKMRLATEIQGDETSTQIQPETKIQAPEIPLKNMKFTLKFRKAARLKARNILRSLPGLRMMLFGIGM